MSRFDVQQDGHTRPILPDRTRGRRMYDTLRERLVTMAYFGGDALFFGPRARA
ncbi:hypothetical protein [Thalassospira sp. MCCC 1A01428]|uniref:hypothetical protein n=1 Tax=Thalassospira sp. MCCC 1A01428 TaxID=1470575 RepID=UPI00143CD414|nr:hypothetical protein [Thalassospira sp. MCCC 1A01428]